MSSSERFYASPHDHNPLGVTSIPRKEREVGRKDWW